MNANDCSNGLDSGPFRVGVGAILDDWHLGPLTSEAIALPVRKSNLGDNDCEDIPHMVRFGSFVALWPVLVAMERG